MCIIETRLYVRIGRGGLDWRTDIFFREVWKMWMLLGIRKGG